MLYMRLLELFCGTKSVGDVFKKYGYEVISLDYDKQFNATHTVDILDWDYKIYPTGYFDVIWGSPDCSTFSVATSGKYRTVAQPMGNYGVNQERADIGNRCVDKLIEIIKYFSPDSWFIENPRGLMKHYPPLKAFTTHHYFTEVFYGNYEWSCPKPTHIWSNKKLWTREKLPVMPESSYKCWTDKKTGKAKRHYIFFANHKGSYRSAIPPLLIERLYGLTVS